MGPCSVSVRSLPTIARLVPGPSSARERGWGLAELNRALERGGAVLVESELQLAKSIEAMQQTAWHSLPSDLQDVLIEVFEETAERTVTAYEDGIEAAKQEMEEAFRFAKDSPFPDDCETYTDVYA